MPAVAGETIFIGSCAGTFYALNKNTGTVQWTYDIQRDGNQRSFHGNALIRDGLILIGTDKSCDPLGIGHVYAFETTTGRVRWKYRSTGIPTDIIPIGDNLFFGSFQGRWYAISSKNGVHRWSFSTDAPNEACEMIKAPVADETHLYVASLDGLIYSLEATSGRVVWKRKLSALPSTGLLLKENALFVGTTDNRIHRLNAATGDTLAELTLEASPTGRLTSVDDSLVLFLENRSNRTGYLLSTDVKLRGIRWLQKASHEWASEQPHLWNGLVVAGNCRGEMDTFRIADGAAQWKLNLTGCIRSIGSDGEMLFVGVQEGTVYALRR